jgi:hypothetical protein
MTRSRGARRQADPPGDGGGSPGALLPFRPDDAATSPARERPAEAPSAPKRARKRDAPRQGAPEGAQADTSAEAEPLDMEALAARGLTPEEIRAFLGLSLPLKPGHLAEMEPALERGRLIGRARLKLAQFEAALQGRVSAQTQMLARLGDELFEQAEEDPEVAVVRRILDPADGDAPGLSPGDSPAGAAGETEDRP